MKHSLGTKTDIPAPWRADEGQQTDCGNPVIHRDNRRMLPLRVLPETWGNLFVATRGEHAGAAVPPGATIPDFARLETWDNRAFA
jgi:hypothetical protein